MSDALFFAVMAAMTWLGALGGFSLKRGMTAQTGGLKGLLANHWLYAGAFFYASSTLLNIWVLMHRPYTIVLPLTAVTYVWTMLLARYALGEHITYQKIIGLVLIGAGACCLVLL